MFDRSRLYLLLLLLVPTAAPAYWTGIAAFFGEGESDWQFSSNVQQATHRYYGLRIEENSDVDVRIGASGGFFSLRLRDPLNPASSEKFDGEFLSFYLRWPVSLTQRVTLHSQLNYQFNQGNSFNDMGDEEDQIDWSELSLRLGLGLQLGRLTIQPYILQRSLDGDVTINDLTSRFDLVEQSRQGLIIDYQVESNAYIRLATGMQDRQSVYFGLVTEY
ncbi:MAG: hypothetical protein QNJ69_13740 [Gammaproteobacteria bacterium]|nr:hypothetical protein [Gammaproteobacteria bacterium]